MWKENKSPVILVEKQGDKFEGRTKALNYRTWLIGQIGKSAKKQDIETELILRGCLNSYNHYHPETNITQEVPRWKGKSSLNILKGIDKLTIIKFQKPEKGMEAKEVRTEVNKEELLALIESLKNLDEGQPIKTKILAMDYSNRLGLGHTGWRTGNFQFFSDRINHNKFCNTLSALEELGFVIYRGGKTTLTNNKISLQEVLL